MAYIPLDASAISPYPEAGADPNGAENVTDYESSTYEDPSLAQLPGQTATAAGSTATSASSVSSSTVLLMALGLGAVLLLGKK
jgi:hypothetical protein